MEAAEIVGEAGADGVVAAGSGGGAEVEEECLEADTRLSKALVPKVGVPWLLSSKPRLGNGARLPGFLPGRPRWVGGGG